MGFRMMGEQGVESIHKYFNDLARTYCGIADEVSKLKYQSRATVCQFGCNNAARWHGQDKENGPGGKRLNYTS